MHHPEDKVQVRAVLFGTLQIEYHLGTQGQVTPCERRLLEDLWWLSVYAQDPATFDIHARYEQESADVLWCRELANWLEAKDLTCVRRTSFDAAATPLPPFPRTLRADAADPEP